MTQQHPITPPPELLEQWIGEIWHEGTPVRMAQSDPIEEIVGECIARIKFQCLPQSFQGRMFGDAYRMLDERT